MRLPFSEAASSITTLATYKEEADFIRLEVVAKTRVLRPGPGQHYFLYQPLKWKGWENHPFTLASWDMPQPLDNSTSKPTQQPDDLDVKQKKDFGSISSKSSNDTLHPDDSSPVEMHQAIATERTDACRLVFLIRPFNGWTRRLRDDCLKSSSRSFQPKILVEGPYGGRSPLHLYENVVLIVGGTGISGAIPYLQDHVRRVKSSSTNDKNSVTRTRKITLVWATKQSAMIYDIAARELQPILERDDIEVSFHATSSKFSPRSSDTDSPEKTQSEKAVFSILQGRPDVNDIILRVADDIRGAGPFGGKVAVLTCGPAAMADAARATIHHILKDGKGLIEYFEETFG